MTLSLWFLLAAMIFAPALLLVGIMALVDGPDPSLGRHRARLNRRRR